MPVLTAAAVNAVCESRRQGGAASATAAAQQLSVAVLADLLQCAVKEQGVLAGANSTLEAFQPCPLQRLIDLLAAEQVPVHAVVALLAAAVEALRSPDGGRSGSRRAVVRSPRMAKVVCCVTVLMVKQSLWVCSRDGLRCYCDMTACHSFMQ